MSEPMWSIPLPADAGPPIEVFVNSIRLDEGTDFTVDGRWVRLRSAVRPRPSLGFWRRILLGIGIGVYGDMRADQVDVSYRVDGRTEFVSGATVIPPQQVADGG